MLYIQSQFYIKVDDEVKAKRVFPVFCLATNAFPPSYFIKKSKLKLEDSTVLNIHFRLG